MYGRLGNIPDLQQSPGEAATDHTAVIAAFPCSHWRRWSVSPIARMRHISSEMWRSIFTGLGAIGLEDGLAQPLRAPCSVGLESNRRAGHL